VVTSAAYWSAASSPGEVHGVEDVELAAGQPAVQELGVDRRHRRVARASNDLHRRLDLGQQVAQGGEFGRVGADVTHRLGHPVTLIRSQVVLADGVGKRVALDAGQRTGDDQPRVSGGHPPIVMLEGPRSYPPANSASGQSPPGSALPEDRLTRWC
jgi:hypothetical protein